MDEVVARRQLTHGHSKLDIAVHRPICVEGNWEIVVAITSSSATHELRVKGEDSMSCLINALSGIRSYLDEDGQPWILFPNSQDDWHWFPVIPPTLDKEFDGRIHDAVNAIHFDYCRGNEIDKNKSC